MHSAQKVWPQFGWGMVTGCALNEVDRRVRMRAWLLGHTTGRTLSPSICEGWVKDGLSNHNYGDIREQLTEHT